MQRGSKGSSEVFDTLQKASQKRVTDLSLSVPMCLRTHSSKRLRVAAAEAEPTVALLRGTIYAPEMHDIKDPRRSPFTVECTVFASLGPVTRLASGGASPPVQSGSRAASCGGGGWMRDRGREQNAADTPGETVLRHQKVSEINISVLCVRVRCFGTTDSLTRLV